MSFAADMKDFVSAFQAGVKIMTPTDAEVRQEAIRFARDEAKQTRNMFERGRSTVGRGSAIDIDTSVEPTEGARRAPSFTDPKLQTWALGIHNNESGGNYAVIGPTHPKLGRALGAYQVMEANLPEWSREAIGRVVPATEFLKSPEIQDKIFAHKFGQYVTQTGNTRDAASMWFTGDPYEKAMARGARDSLGTRVDDYVSKFERAIARLRPRTAALDLEGAQFAATGGMIGEGDTDEQGRIKHPVDAGMDAKIERGDVRTLLDMANFPKMLDDGMSFLTRQFGLDRAAVPDASPATQDGRRAFAMNVGAPTPAMVAELTNGIDPDGQLDNEQRNVAGWNGLYNFYSTRGEPDKAARAAGAMLMYSKQASQRAGALALAALEKGDVKGAANAIKAAYEYFPDGKSLRVQVGDRGEVNYSVVDMDGRGLHKGKMRKEEIQKVAQGMMDGSQWFQAVSAARVPEDKTARRTARRGEAREAFEAEYSADDEEGFIAGLSESARKKFLKMDPADKKEYLQRHMREGENEAKTERFQQRMQHQLESRDRREALDLFKFGIRYNQWETMREQVLTENERRARQREDEESGRNKRQEISIQERRRRDEEMLKRRTKEKDGAGMRLTAKEAAAKRATEAIDLETEGRLATEEQRVRGQFPPEATEEEIQADIGRAQGPIRAGRAFRQAVPAERVRDFSDDDLTAIHEYFDQKKLVTDPRVRDAAAAVAADIRMTNPRILPAGAAAAVERALDPDAPDPMVDPRTGAVKIPGSFRPVVLSEEGLINLAALREAAKRGKPKPAPTSRSAIPEVVSPAQAREQGRTSALDLSRRQAEEGAFLSRQRDQAPGGASYEALRQELGADFAELSRTLGRPPSYEQLQKAVTDMRTEEMRQRMRAANTARRFGPLGPR